MNLFPKHFVSLPDVAFKNFWIMLNLEKFKCYRCLRPHSCERHGTLGPLTRALQVVMAPLTWLSSWPYSSEYCRCSRANLRDQWVLIHMPAPPTKPSALPPPPGHQPGKVGKFCSILQSMVFSMMGNFFLKIHFKSYYIPLHFSSDWTCMYKNQGILQISLWKKLHRSMKSSSWQTERGTFS